jgi:protein tyrosine/serine phosphatase
MAKLLLDDRHLSNITKLRKKEKTNNGHSDATSENWNKINKIKQFVIF